MALLSEWPGNTRLQHIKNEQTLLLCIKMLIRLNYSLTYGAKMLFKVKLDKDNVF